MVPLIALMVVPTGIPVPAVRGCPTANPAMLGTYVMPVWPLVRMPLNVVMVVDPLEAMAFTAGPVGDDPIEILLPMFVMYVFRGMPGPVMPCPFASPERLPTGVMVELPMVTTPVNVIRGVELAGAESVIVVGTAVPEAVPAMVVLAWMPGPVMPSPTVSPEMVDTDVMVLLPLVT